MFDFNSKKEGLRILFIGMPDMALICLNEFVKNKKNIIGIVPPHSKDPSFGSMAQAAQQFGVPFISYKESLKDADFINTIKSLKPDIAVVASYNYLLPKELYEIPRLGTINCHPSLLPDYRGANPYFHVINNGETHTGITYHYMDESFDTGDIILQASMPIQPNDTMGTLFNKINHNSAKLYIDLINKIENGEELPRIQQDKESHYKKATKIMPEKGHNIIDWKKDAQAIERFIRALNPFFGGITYFRNVALRVWSGKYSNNINVSNIEPGTIIKTTDDKIIISTGNGVFMPEVIQFGTFFTSGIKDFIELCSPQKGEQFSTQIIQ